MFGDDSDPLVMTERVGFGTTSGRARGGQCTMQRGSNGRTTKERLDRERSTETRKKRQLSTGASFLENMQCNAHDDMMNATNKIKTHGEHEIYGSLLEHRSRGVTTLQHYKRISSRDLGWHQREAEKKEKR